MAYIASLSRCHKSGCDKPATHEVKGLRNESWGKYCAPHSKTRLKEVLRIESEDRARVQEPPQGGGR